MTDQPNIIKALRDLVPQRVLTYREAQQIAELQANVLRELLGVQSERFPTEALAWLPRIQLIDDPSLRVSGTTYWDRGRWIIRLNTSEPRGRVRFSLCHEFKHVLDHTTKSRLYHDNAGFIAEDNAERLAEFFAGCLLMPKRHVKRLFGERRTLADLTATFDVTPRAMQVRLSQLGLIDAMPRCDAPRIARGGGAYFRSPSIHFVEVAA